MAVCFPSSLYLLLVKFLFIGEFIITHFYEYFNRLTFSLLNEKRGDTCDEKSQISPPKRHGKGSLLLPCSKMPVGIFFVKTRWRRHPDGDKSPIGKSDSALCVQNKKHFLRSAFCFGGATRNRTGDKGFADLCLTAWLWRRIKCRVGYTRHMERITGLEPATSTLARSRSTK